jgi:hypothetical protein
MKNSTLAIIFLLVMNCVTLWVALDNRNLIALTIDNLDTISHTFDGEDTK